MRRKERETAYEEAVKILRGCMFATVALRGGEYPYAVPMHFGLSEEGGLALYFHCALEGKKLALIGSGVRAAFSAVRFCENIPPKGEVCTASARYESVFGEGELSPVFGEEKARGLRLLLEHYAIAGELPPAAENRVCVLKFTVRTLTGKRHL